jgi:FkbM family methyltransferase
MSFLKGPLMYYRLFGAKGLLLGAKARLLRLSIQVLVTVPGIKHPISLRLRSTDVELCQEILVHAQYASNLPQSPKVIVDAGANIGLTAIFFANRYPATRIIAVEPDSSNYEMLRKNVAPYPNIIAVRAALWNENGEINLADPGAGQTAYQTFERSEGSDRRYQVVPAVTLDRLMNHFDIHFIDLLKVDIEGSEKEVFERSAPWISSVGVIAIELHDWMRTGCGETVRCAAKEFEREWQQGELTFFVKNYPEANAAIEPHQLKNSSRKNIREKWPLKIVQVT